MSQFIRNAIQDSKMVVCIGMTISAKDQHQISGVSERVRPAFRGNIAARVFVCFEIMQSLRKNGKGLVFLEQGLFVVVVNDLCKKQNRKCAQKYRVGIAFTNAFLKISQQ